MMSAKGRYRKDGSSPAENPLDFFETPSWCVAAIARHLPPAMHVLDPAAGRGALLDALRAAGRGGAVCTSAFEIDEGRARECAGRGYVADAEIGSMLGPLDDLSDCAATRDALGPESWGRPDLIVANPPYSLAGAFVSRALAEVAPGGTVAMLLRVNWLGGRLRVDFHREHPADVYVHASRPSYTGNGRSDATEAAWFVWGPARGGRWYILDDFDPARSPEAGASRRLALKEARAEAEREESADYDQRVCEVLCEVAT